MSGRGRGRGGGRGGGGRGGGRGGGGRGGSGRGGGRGNAPSVAPMMPSVASTSSSPSSLSGDLQNLALNVPAVAQVPTSTPVQPAQPPPPMQPSQTVVQVAPASSKSLRPPTRPQFGTIGKKVTVRANHFRVEFPDVNIHHYDVDINPEVKSKKVCRDILNNLVNLYRESHLGKRRLAYDGKKSVFTAGALPFESKEFVVKLVENDGGPRREREFKVSIKFAAKPDIDHLRQFLSGRQHNMPQETIQALDVVLRAGPSMSIDTEVVGRSFFSIKFGQASLENGLEYWKGFYQSLRPTQMGLSLNIDMSARAFYEPILVSDYVANNFRRDPSRPFSDQDRVKIKRALKGVKVEVCHGEYVRRYRIASLSTQPIHALTFTDQTGATLSVVQYFREKYNITLRQLMLPAIQVGTDAKPTYLPMEVCRFLRGQRYLKKLNERQVSNLLRATCTRPADREGIIHNMVRNNNYNRDEFVKEFGIQVRAEMTSVEARILPPPPLKYHDTGKERLVNPQVGAWNMINKKMINGGKVDCWACINFSRLNYDQVDRFCYELGTMCTSKGMVFNPKPVIPHSQNHAGNIERALIDIHTKCLAQLKATGKQLELLIVILPDMSGHYGKIKRVCETELGIVSQCCQPKNVTKLSKQYFENVSLKINVKVGGRNTVLLHAIERKIPYLTDRPTIIFGADVTHPQPGEDSSPSIAAVVASMDWPEVTKYRGLVSAQPHRQEIIEDLYKTHQDPVKGVVHSGMIREHLMAFYKSTGQKPDRILFYRDGVSEGQFNQVLLEEIDKIRKACVSLQDNYLPRVTFVVVQKRHHTRLFPANHQDRSATDRSGNIIAGTVVDTSICHPTEFDFYLCSHAGIQGTSRPAHYHVLYDENKFNADALQMLTNSLCYTYARCTRSVSIVPPAYYAHLAAFRARYYVEGDISETDSSTAGAATRANVVAVRPLPSIIDKVKDVMFFC